MDWQKTAVVFPGQGSQQVGMGVDFAQQYLAARSIYDLADDLLDTNLSAIMFGGPADKLDQTYNTQPALYVNSIAIWRTLRATMPDARPAFFAGHSLGEFTALNAARSLRFEDGLRLVRERARLMRDAGEANPGAMAALLAIEPDQADALCARASAETTQPVVIANDNCPGQIVLSGAEEAIDAAVQLAPEFGAKRAVKLAVSIAAHSPLMASASDAFRLALAETTFHQPDVPIYGNVNAAPLLAVDSIRAELDAQLTNAVRWSESVQAMIDDGATTFIEIGAGDVLSGLIKRIDRTTRRITINSVESFQAFIESAREEPLDV
jgi:[acyl-carrier-protein] S-malonyltransferase